MAYPSVTDAQHRGTRTRRGRGLPWRRPQAPAPVVEHSPFPDPDLPTQVIPPHRQPRATLKPSATVHGSHPSHLLFAFAHRAMDVCADPKADHRAAYDALAPLMQSLLEGAKAEANFDRRSTENKAAAEAQGATLDDAAKRGHDIGPESPHGMQAVADIVDRAKRAPAPESTALMSKLTPAVLAQLDAGVPVGDVAQTRVLPVVEAVAATVDASPVRVPGDSVRPAIAPTDGSDDEEVGPGFYSPLAASVLSRRSPRPVTVMPAPMADGEPVGLRSTQPAYGQVFAGDWVFDDSGPGDVDVLKLVRDVAIVYGENTDPVAARIFFADGTDRRVAEDRAVRAMSAAKAAPLLEKYEAQLAEFQGAPAGGAL